MPTNPDQVYRDEAEKLLTDWEYTGPTHVLSKETDRRQDLVEAIASALAARGRVREGHVRDHDGNEWVVIVKTPVGVWPSDEMARVNVAGTTLLYVREAAQLPHP